MIRLLQTILHKKKNPKKGFTLIEMIVSVGIFTIVMTIAIGALLVVYDTYRKTRTLKNAMDNVNIATESMIKKIRTGDNFKCLVPGQNPCLWLRFTGKDQIAYEYAKYVNGVGVKKCKIPTPKDYSCLSSQTFQPVTSADVEIKGLSFYLYGLEDDFVQDSVTVTISGFANIPGKTQFDSNFRVQTTVSKRLLDVF
jgi:prepilin-type N-terminal cleavage/methylation domain-containing protein